MIYKEIKLISKSSGENNGKFKIEGSTSRKRLFVYHSIADSKRVKEDNRTGEGKTGCYNKSILTIANSPIIII